MPGNGICRDPGFKNFLVQRGHSPPRTPPLGIPEPTAESLRKSCGEHCTIFVDDILIKQHAEYTYIRLC